MFGLKVFKVGIDSRYSIQKNPSFYAGPWAVHTATIRKGLGSSSNKNNENGSALKERTKVSVFIFDKRKMESTLIKNGAHKSNFEDAYRVLRKQVSNLAKMRHPAILELIEPLEESSSKMMFVSEYTTNCVKNLIDMSANRNYDSNLPDNQELDDIVIQQGLLQIIQGLEFLHNAGFVHLGLEPNSILINNKGDWKISGLAFIQNLKENENKKEKFYLEVFDSRMPRFVNINLDYSAPELVLDNELSPSNDLFSIGCLIYSIYLGTSLFETYNNSSSYKQQLNGSLRKIKFLSKESSSKIPSYLLNTLNQLITRSSNERYSLIQFQSSKYFDNILVRTIKFLDEFPTKTDNEKQNFMKGLNKIMNQFPISILSKKILPTLIETINQFSNEQIPKYETQPIDINDPLLISLTLINILNIVKDLSQLTFKEKILPILNIKKILKFPSSQKIIFENIELIELKINNKEEFKNFILPIFELSLSPIQSPLKIQEISLNNLSKIIKNLNFLTIKNEIFPKIGQLFSKTTHLKIKILGLKTFEILIDSKGFDKYTIDEKLLPLLKNIKTKEPSVLLSTLKVFEKISLPEENGSSIILDIDKLAIEILPQLWQMSMATTLNGNQFKQMVSVINRISQRIETEHLKKLNISNIDESSDTPIITSTNSDNEDIDFESLVYGTIRNKTPTPTPKPKPKPKPKPNNVQVNKVPQHIKPLTLKPSPSKVTSKNDDFDDFQSFQSAPGLQTPISTSTPNTSNSWNKSNESSGIDWSSEAYKAKNKFSSLSSSSYSSLQPQTSNFGRSSNSPSNTNSNFGRSSPLNSNTPLGWNSQPLTPTNKSAQSINSNRSISQRDNKVNQWDSLI